MTQELFRQEAVEFSTRRLYGQVTVLPRISHLVILGVIALALVLFVATLLTGVHVERQAVFGRLLHAESEPAVELELFLPEALRTYLQAGQELELRVLDFAPGEIKPISARVTHVSLDTRVSPAQDGAPAFVYVPVHLQVDHDALRAAGLPLTGNYQLRIRSEVLTAEMSWLSWLANAITGGRRTS